MCVYDNGAATMEISESRCAKSLLAILRKALTYGTEEKSQTASLPLPQPEVHEWIRPNPPSRKNEANGVSSENESITSKKYEPCERKSDEFRKKGQGWEIRNERQDWKGFLAGTVFSEEDKPSNTSVNESPGENEHTGKVLPFPEDAMAEKGVPQRWGDSVSGSIFWPLHR